VLALVVAIGAAVQASRDSTGVVARDPRGVVDRYALAVGPADADVVVDVYEDFMCPFCGQLEAASRPVVESYAGSSVQFRYHVISFLDRASSTEYSSRATNALAVVLDTSGPEVAKEFHDAVYEDQPEEGTAGLSDEDLIRKAVAAGADEDEVSGPIRRRAFRQWVTNATDAASRAGISSTPTVMVDGKPLPQAQIPETVQEMKDAIERGLS
jgi:protein-disulfide isomerase